MSPNDRNDETVAIPVPLRKATNRNDRINPRFVLTLNLDIELDRVQAIGYFPIVRETLVPGRPTGVVLLH